MDNNPPSQPAPSDAVSLTAPDEADLTGQTLGDFLILRRLGQGGMGQVYVARQLSLNRQVAFKILKADLAEDATALRRFQAEAEVVARATHSNIVQIYAVGEHQGLRFMALEFVEGFNLRQYLEKKGPPDLPLALSIMRQVAAALHRAGELGIIHRDIKPENILLTRKGEVKVADFGLSRCFVGNAPSLNLTQSGVTLGTPLYMSPEQVQGHAIDPRTDIYSFGVTCYAMLTGNPPFRGQTAFEVAMQHVQSQAEPLARVRPDLPPLLCAIVDKMMAKKPEDRYQTAREILQDLAHLRASLTPSQADQKTPSISLGQGPSGSSLTVPLPAQSTAAIFRNHRFWLRAAMVLSILTALAGGALLGWRRNQSTALPLATESAPADAAAIEALFSQQNREKVLQAEVDKTVNPGDDRDKLVRGLDARLQLGLLYLDQWRLDDADRFFTDQLGEPYRVQAYRLTGRLGNAIVLALQDKAAESNNVFVEAMGGKNQPPRQRTGRVFVINRNPRFHMKIAEALDRNAANKKPPPADLQELRLPQPLAPPLKVPNGHKQEGDKG